MKNHALWMLPIIAIGTVASAQNSAITGKVVDADGYELPGVNVSIKGTKIGTLTSIDGTFSISNIPDKEKAVIVFSYVGYKTVEMRVGSQTSFNLMMKEDTENLDEVVILGYGSQSRKNLTGAVSQIDSKVIGVQNVSTVSKALEGSIPGLQVSAADGQPGVDMGIRVRGVSSATGNNASALIVIDGVPAQNENPLSNMNPQDIETITVLKDAASTAMYGSRGANGVVLITTKKGKTGKTRISFDARWGWNSIGSFNTSGMTSAADYYTYVWQSIYNSYRYGVNGTGRPGIDENGVPYTNVNNPNHTHEEAAKFASEHLFNYNSGASNSETNFYRNGLGNWMAYNVPGAIYTPDGGTGVLQSATMSGQYLVGLDGKINPNAQFLYGDGDTYADALLNTAFRQEYNISASGGSDKVSYYTSLGYLSDPSYIRSSDFERYSGRANVDAKLFKWLKVGANVGYTRTTTNAMSTKWGRNPGAATGNVMLYVNGHLPTMSMWAREANSDGSIGNIIYVDGQKKEAGVEGSSYSPLGSTAGNQLGRDILFEIDENKNQTEVDLWTSRVYADFSFLKDFKLTVNFSMDQHANKLTKYLNSKSGLGDGVGGIGIQKYTQRIINTQQLLSYNKDINKHHVDALIGHEYNDLDKDMLSWGSAYELIPGYISPGNFTSHYYNISNLATPGWSLDKVRMESYMARANYVYDDKYYLSGSVRSDGSSKFMINKWGTFWSVGGGWRFTSEPFMQATKGWLDNAKLRASYGVIGNQNGIGNYTNHTWTYGVAVWNPSTNGQGTGQEYSIGYGSLINEELTWETVHTTDIGLDFSLFGNKLVGSVDFYDNLTVNSFYNEPVSILGNAGAETRQRNSAKLRNRGFELELSTNIINTRDWTWSVSLNGTHYRTILVDVPESTIPAWNETSDLPKGTWLANGEGWSATGSGDTSFPFYLRGEGRDWYNIYLYKYAGVDQNSGLPMYWHRVTYDDVHNNDHGGRYANYQVGDNVPTTVSSDASQYEMGSAIPKWIGGFTTSLRYKDFDLQVILAYQLGGKFFSTEYANGLYRSAQAGIGYEPQSTDLLGNTWTPQNTNAYFPMQWYAVDENFYYDGSTFGSWKYTDMSLFSASYLRCKNITLGYTLPQNLLDKIHISKLRVYASADNLFFVSAKKGVDPSMALTGGWAVGQYIYPTMRTMSIGINLEF